MASQESSSVGRSGGLPAGAAATWASASPASVTAKPTTSAPALCSSERRDNEKSVFAFIALSSRHLLGGFFHRAQDCRVRAAAAFQACERLANFGIGRLLVRVEEGCCRHHPAIETIAALDNLLLDIGRLNRMWLIGRAEALQSHDLVAGSVPNGRR